MLLISLFMNQLYILDLLLSWLDDSWLDGPPLSATDDRRHCPCMAIEGHLWQYIPFIGFLQDGS